MNPSVVGDRARVKRTSRNPSAISAYDPTATFAGQHLIAIVSIIVGVFVLFGRNLSLARETRPIIW